MIVTKAKKISSLSQMDISQLVTYHLMGVKVKKLLKSNVVAIREVTSKRLWTALKLLTSLRSKISLKLKRISFRSSKPYHLETKHSP
jgi:hypothetical protein